MKKTRKIIFIILIVLVLLVIGVIFLITKRNNVSNEYKGSKNFDYIENSIDNGEYFEFEEDNQRYILFKIIEGVYAPDSIKIESAKIIDRKYENNVLYLNIDIKTNIKEGIVPNDMCIDGYNTDSRTFILKVDSKFNGLVINGTEYSLLSDKIVMNDNKKYGYIDENGNLTIPVEYDGLFEIKTTNIFDDETNEYVEADFSNYLRAVKDDKQGIIDKQGNIIINLQYDYISTYSKDAFVVENDSKLGIVNKNNELVKGYVEGNLTSNNLFGKYLIYLKYENEQAKKGVLDRNLNIVLEPIYDNFTNFNFTRYNNNGKFNSKYFGGENGITFSKDYIVVEKDNQTAIMDADYNFVTPFTELSVSDIRNKYESELLEMISQTD